MVNLLFHNSINFGDYLSKVITEHLSGEKVQLVDENSTSEHYLCVGSLLTHVNEHSIVWGTGTAYKTDKINKAKMYCSVRGKMSQQLVHKAGYSCNSYGDPVLLMPYIYKPKEILTKYELGIIPHWIDYMIAMTHYRESDGTKVIDLLKPYKKVIDDILSCKYIISSSLHGLIVAHAYNVPAMWCEFSDNILTDGFKYHDYLSSVDIPVYDVINLKTDKVETDKILNMFGDYCEAKINLSNIIESCPFNNIRMEI